MIQVPTVVRKKAKLLGDEGIYWLENLPDIVKKLEHNWRITAGESLKGGSEAYVAEAVLEDSSEAVLKVALPEMQGNAVFAQEVSALEIANGNGYARVIRYDHSCRALLLERLGTPLKDLGYSAKRQVEIICTELKKSWIWVPTDARLQYGDRLIEWFSTFINELWEELGKPCSKRAIDLALSYLQSRAADFKPETAVLVHGDAHNGNLLQDRSQPSLAFKFIDPDGLAAEPAYDLGVLMREWIDELIPDPVRLGHERCSFLSEYTGISVLAIWEWGYIQCISTGLFLIQSGQVQTGLQMLKVAEAWSESI